MLVAVLTLACSNQSEAQRCDQLADNMGTSDCNDGLVCTSVSIYGFICCPGDRRNATTPQCAIGNPGINGDSAPPTGDASAESSIEAGGDATDSAVGAADGPSEGASDGGGGLMLMLSVSLPVLGVAAVAGMLIAAFQAASQIQDPTMAHLPRLLAVIAVLAVIGPWMGHEIARFAEHAFVIAGR
jgi:type III secretory pathway component EscS